MARKSKITPELLREAMPLAQTGHTDKQIYTSLGISHTTFYGNSELLATVKRAQSSLRKLIAAQLLKSLTAGEVSAQIFLTKRLNLFTTSYKLPRVKNTSTALKALDSINQALAGGEMPSELANNLVKNIQVFIKAYEVSELEKRLEEIEEHIRNEKESVK